MTRFALGALATLAVVLAGCGGGGGNGFTTPDGDPFGDGFSFFIGGSIFPTLPGTGAAARDTIVPHRGAPDQDDEFNSIWDLDSFDAPEINVGSAGTADDTLAFIAIDWGCNPCGSQSDEDFLAIFEAALDVLTDRFGTPDDSDLDGLEREAVWNESGFDVRLNMEARDGGSVGGTRLNVLRT